MKKLVAYSSISHMGYVMLGMATFTPQGINGAVLQMFNHGTVTAMLFLLVGVIYDRAHHRRIDGFGGLASVMPVYTGIMTIAFFAAMGLPGLSAFISEVLVLLGGWQYNQVLTIIAASAVVLTAGYMLWMLQRVWLGPLNEKYASLPDVNMRELVTLVPLGDHRDDPRRLSARDPRPDQPDARRPERHGRQGGRRGGRDAAAAFAGRDPVSRRRGVSGSE
jgi:NADH-quinone oxidoreductase subunit M